MLDVVAAVFWVLGAAFCLLAAVGVVRMPDVFTRMQAASKASTLGLACLLVGTTIELGDGATLARAVSIAAFIMLTTPVAAHVVARAAYFTNVPLWSGTVVDERREDQDRDDAVARPSAGSAADEDLSSGDHA
jgi:multicomponent Na+:H+ antiporter subunit G